MKLTKEHKNTILSNIDKNIDKRSSKTNIIGIEEVDSPTFVGVKLMAKKTEKPPVWFTDFAEKLDRRLDSIENRMDIIEKDIAAIKACPTIKRELGQ